MNSSVPLVTVLIPAYNCEKYIKKCLDSIINQDYKNLEILVIDDGSIDKTVEIVKSSTDPRIKLELNKKNLGLPKTLNKGFKLASGNYVARMDADDISLSSRIGIQVKFLENNPDHGMVGTLFARINDSGDIFDACPELIYYEEIKDGIKFMNSFCNGSIMFRKSFIDTEKISYDPTYAPYEDYELWTRVVNLTKASNIPNVLYLYSINPNGLTLTQTHKMNSGALALSKKLITKSTLPKLTPSYIKHLIIRSGKYTQKNVLINNKLYPCDLRMVYQTYVYKLGLAYLSKLNILGIIVLSISFFLSPLNWLKKGFNLLH